MGDQPHHDELDRALERALAVAVAFVRRPATERTLGRVLASAEALTVLAPLARPVPTNVTLAPLPVPTVLDDVGSVFRSAGSSDGDA